MPAFRQNPGGGGCELFVTKIELDSECDSKEEDIFMPPLNGERFLLPGTTKKNAEGRKIHLTYSFEELDFLISACKELHKRGFFGKSSFYRDEEGKYFLFISAGLEIGIANKQGNFVIFI